MSSRHEIVGAGVDIICDHLLGVLFKLKRQRQSQMMRRWISKRKTWEWAADDFHPSRRSKQAKEIQNDRDALNIDRTQLEHCDNDMPVRGENPPTVDTAVQDINIKMEIKQEIDLNPESLCNDACTSNSFVNQAQNTSEHISEDVQQFATLCEVYMPPSPSSSNEHHSGCQDNGNESVLIEGAATLQKIRSLKREVSSLRMQLANLEFGIRTFLSDDQILYLRHKSSGDFMWSAATIRKAKKIQSACGVKGYNRLREMGFPLPGKATVAHESKQVHVKRTKKS